MKKITIFILLALSLLNAKELDIDSLLGDIEKKTDLSSKTKLENGGISFIYTRDDLRRMQAKTLKDVLKSSYPFGYTQNRYALPDPFYIGTAHPFLSSRMRVFIDDQELSTSLYGSGMITYGNIELEFIDHIEVYTGNPTYEFSTEPTLVLVKLYSKKAQKDAGSKLSATVGNFGDSLFSFYNSAELDSDWSYFAYLSQNSDIQKKDRSHGVELSRDSITTHIFASFYDENNKILIDAGKVKKDTFMDQSLDATPTDANMAYDSLHIGYNGKYDNLSYLLSYDLLNTKTNYADDVAPFLTQSLDTNSKSFVISSELKYNYTTQTNRLIAGVKYRYKGFEYSTILLNGADLPRSGNTNQTIATAFVENQYSLQENSILTTGISLSKVQNNHSIQNDDLMMYRVGHTYTTDSFIFKSIYSHIELTLDPYLVNSIYITAGKKDITKEDVFLENIIYEKESDKYELIIGILKDKNHLMPNTNGLLENYSKIINMSSAIVMWTHKYNEFDKLYLTVEYTQRDNLPSTGTKKQYKSTIRSLNTYNKFDIFNELLYSRDNLEKKNFYDYSVGVIYHKTQDLTISLKATNIFDKAQTTDYARINPQTFQTEEPLKISPIDRHIMLSMEYLF